MANAPMARSGKGPDRSQAGTPSFGAECCVVVVTGVVVVVVAELATLLPV